MTPRFPSEFWSEHRRCAAAFPQAGSDYPLAGDLGRSQFGGPGVDGEADETRKPSLLAFDKPLALCIPEGYELNYAYPLMIWLHGSGGSERELSRLMPAISTRNYFGISLRGPLAANEVLPGGFRWSQDEQDIAALEGELHETVCQLRREFHIHSERIYVAGFDDGATMSLRLMLRRPEWFAGAIALSGKFPQTPQPLSRFRDLQGTRVFVAVGTRDRDVSVAELIQTGRLLHAAGVDVTTRVYHAAHEITDEMLDHVNHWMMDGILSANLI